MAEDISLFIHKELKYIQDETTEVQELSWHGNGSTVSQWLLAMVMHDFQAHGAKS